MARLSRHDRVREYFIWINGVLSRDLLSSDWYADMLVDLEESVPAIFTYVGLSSVSLQYVKICKGVPFTPLQWLPAQIGKQPSKPFQHVIGNYGTIISMEICFLIYTANDYNIIKSLRIRSYFPKKVAYALAEYGFMFRSCAIHKISCNTKSICLC